MKKVMMIVAMISLSVFLSDLSFAQSRKGFATNAVEGTANAGDQVIEGTGKVGKSVMKGTRNVGKKVIEGTKETIDSLL